jgi:cytosine/adenosine deaminase-related metal-dependent hydrolase
MSSQSSQSLTLTARFVFPIEKPPLAGGSVTIERDKIVAVEPHGVRRPDIDLGDAAILPGFVNAHTHLDLSGLRGMTPPTTDFVGWLRQVIAQRREQKPDQIQADIQLGLDESVSFGTTLIGDIAAGGQSWQVLVNSPVRSVIFYELLGLSRARAHQSWAAACTWLNARPQSSQCRPGLSPHAPYSVRTSLFVAARRLGQMRRLPLAIHFAESAAELELLRERAGAMVPFLTDLGVYDVAGLTRTLSELIELFTNYPEALFVHGNYLLSECQARSRMHVVYCPRTHRAFGHTSYPLAEYLRSGACVALGTDSLASNPDLNLFKEAQFVRRHHPQVSPGEILHMATLNGARALGWAEETGSIAPGKAADLAVVELPDRLDDDPAALVLDDAATVRGVMIGGVWHKDPRGQTEQIQRPM